MTYIPPISGRRSLLLTGTTITGTTTAVSNTFYPITLAASLGAVVITLPSAPPVGTVVEFVRTDNNSFTSFARITPGGTDTITGASAAYYNISVQNSVISFTYIGTTWYPMASMPSLDGVVGLGSAAAFNPSIILRDNNGRAQVSSPVAALDIANKTYADQLSAAQYYEENVINSSTLASGWQSANSSSGTPTLVGSFSSSVNWTTATLTTPAAGIYEFGMSFITGSISGPARVIGQFGTGVGTGTTYYRTEYNLSTGGSGYAGITVTGKKYLFSGQPVVACIYASGGAIGVTMTGLYIYFNLVAQA